MTFFDDLSIRSKVIGGLAAMLVVCCAVGLFAVSRLGAVNDAAADIRNDWLPGVRALGQVAVLSERSKAIQNNIISAPAGQDNGKAEQALKATLGARAMAWKQYEALISPGEEQQLADQVKARWDDYAGIWDRIEEMLKKGDRAGASALNSGDNLTAMGKLRDAIEADVKFNSQGADAAARNGDSLYVSAKMWIFGALAIAVGVGFVIAFLLISGVSKPITAMTEAMKRLAAHDLKTQIQGVGRKDEVGAMASAVQVFKDNMIEADRLTAAQEAERESKEKRARTLTLLPRASRRRCASSSACSLRRRRRWRRPRNRCRRPPTRRVSNR